MNNNFKNDLLSLISCETNRFTKRSASKMRSNSERASTHCENKKSSFAEARFTSIRGISNNGNGFMTVDLHKSCSSRSTKEIIKERKHNESIELISFS